MNTPNVHTPRPSTPNEIRKAKRRARDAWQAVADAKTSGASPVEVAQLEADARAASDAWYAARGVANPHALAKGRAA